jgi:hypothetical protein
MARPIEATPTLRGEAARRFVAAAKNPEPFSHPKVQNDQYIEQLKQKLLNRESKSPS